MAELTNQINQQQNNDAVVATATVDPKTLKPGQLYVMRRDNRTLVPFLISPFT